MIKYPKKSFLLSFVFILFFVNVSIIADARNDLLDNIILSGQPLVNKNSISLTWNIENPTQPFDFEIMRKRADEIDYSVLGTGQHKAEVTVLNLYPTISRYDGNGTNSGRPLDIPLDVAYTTWDGEYIENLPQSARLKRWMEEPNSENEKGYGKGIIEVIPISIDDFNLNPETLLFKEHDQYYTIGNDEKIAVDAIMIGSWDGAFNDTTVTIDALDSIKRYLDDRGSIIFGHDVITSITSFKVFSDYIDAKLESSSGVSHINGAKVQPIKNGSILEEPWFISSDELSIPITHSTNQLVNSKDVWVNFSSGYTGILIEEDGYTNNHYLTIKNNIAMIQTGHSTGQATIDEQKMLANTLFYMTQVSSTSGTSFVDSLGRDVSPPNKPILTSVSVDVSENKIRFMGDESNDIGTDYSYYVKGTGANNGASINSNAVEVNIEEGIAGYSYVINTNPSGAPDNNIDINSIENEVVYEFSNANVRTHYLHIKSIDTVGNFSETTHVKLTSLEHEIAIDNVIIAEDEPSVANIKLARDAVNNLPESYIKEELQRRLNDISIDISLDKSMVSSNLDIYIKSENMLSLSLDTNSVSFDNFSGAEDVEKQNAINLTVSSSLPYKVDASLQSEIQNSDKSKTMDKSILNIKANSNATYKAFSDILSPITLLDDQSNGNGVSHGIDFKLKGNIAHEKDVYKTTIKIEVEQK